MSTNRVTLTSVPKLMRDKDTNHVRIRETLDSMGNELAELRKLPELLAAREAEIEGLKTALETFRSFFSSGKIVNTPQLSE